MALSCDEKARFACRSNRPPAPYDQIATMHRSFDGLLHLCFQSVGCRFSQQSEDACVMCDYGVGRELHPAEVDAFFASDECRRNADAPRVLVGSFGSVLDPYEIPAPVFEAILSGLQGLQAKTIIFETHYTTVNERKLAHIREALPNRAVIIEMGLETVDPLVQKRSLRKAVDLDKLQNVMGEVKAQGMQSCLNVYLGAPLLEPHEQIEDTLRTVRWAFAHGADSVVIFPSNIKPFTGLYRMYCSGKYEPISQWLVMSTLASCTPEELARITLSWYGDRQGFYGKGYPPNVPPLDCPECHDAIAEFYRSYHLALDGLARDRLVKELFERDMACSCRGRTLRSIER